MVSYGDLRWIHKVEPSEAGIAVALSRIVQALESIGLSKSYGFSIELCLQEALVNALVHGVRERGGANIMVRCHIDAERIRIAVEDDGCISAAKICQSTHHDLEHSGGWGLLLIRAFMSRISLSGSGHGLCMELDFDGEFDPSTESARALDPLGSVVHAGEHSSSTGGDFHAD